MSDTIPSVDSLTFLAHLAIDSGGIARSLTMDCYVITGEKLTELLAKARKYDAASAKDYSYTALLKNRQHPVSEIKFVPTGSEKFGEIYEYLPLEAGQAQSLMIEGLQKWCEPRRVVTNVLKALVDKHRADRDPGDNGPVTKKK